MRVTDLERSERFYCEHLGLTVTQRSYPGARFLAADGYHHHVAINTWGNPRSPWQPDTPGLGEAVIGLAGRTAGERVVDPDGIPLRLEPIAAGKS